MVITTLSSSSAKFDEDCPERWTKYRKKCFFPVKDRVTFAQAIDICSQFNSTLAMIESMGEQTFVEDHFMQNSLKDENSVWIGCMRFQKKDHTTASFRWLNGSPVDFCLWHPIEPNNNGGRQFCVALWGGREYTGTWFDYGCDQRYLALCQKPLNGLLMLPKDMPKAKTFDFAIKESYQNVDSAYVTLHSLTFRLWILSILCMILLSVLTAMCFFGNFSKSTLSRFLPWKSKPSEANGLVIQINDMQSIADQEARIINNNHCKGNCDTEREVDDSKRTGGVNNNLPWQ